MDPSRPTRITKKLTPTSHNVTKTQPTDADLRARFIRLYAEIAREILAARRERASQQGGNADGVVAVQMTSISGHRDTGPEGGSVHVDGGVCDRSLPPSNSFAEVKA